MRRAPKRRRTLADGAMMEASAAPALRGALGDGSSWEGTRVTWVLSLIWTAGLGFVLAGCADKDQPAECPSLEGDSCPAHDLAEEQSAAVCDICGTVWVCHLDWDGHWYVKEVDWDCSCINDEGFLEVGDTASTGCTWEL